MGGSSMLADDGRLLGALTCGDEAKVRIPQKIKLLFYIYK
jgi:hypothetical protein